MRVHLVGVSGTGMGQLAMLLVEAGHEVSGSDASFDPPIGPALEKAGVKCLRGWDAAHIGKDLELVVIGNAIRRENPEAVRATELDLPRSSMSKTLRDLFLVGRRPLVVCGTHGKTTTSAMCAWILACADLEPGYFIGGLPKNFPTGAAIGSTKKKLMAPRAPFVVEGDEYDAVYWHKEPKFFDYVGSVRTTSRSSPASSTITSTSTLRPRSTRSSSHCSESDWARASWSPTFASRRS